MERAEDGDLGISIIKLPATASDACAAGTEGIFGAWLALRFTFESAFCCVAAFDYGGSIGHVMDKDVLGGEWYYTLHLLS